MDEIRYCSLCNNEFPIENFVLNKHGLYPYCERCHWQAEVRRIKAEHYRRASRYHALRQKIQNGEYRVLTHPN